MKVLANDGISKSGIEALEKGEAFYKETKGKHTYIYRLRK